jgi:hypothetical protein
VVYPAGAGEIEADGTFRPKSDFFGRVRIGAVAGGMSAEYVSDDSTVLGQKVNFALRYREEGADTAKTRKGLSVVFPSGVIEPGVTNVTIEAEVPGLVNYVYRGSEEYRMADSISFDVISGRVDRMRDSVFVIFDIPPRLQDAARTGDHQFRVARWFTDSLRWVPMENSVLLNNGAAVGVWLYSNPSDALRRQQSLLQQQLPQQPKRKRSGSKRARSDAEPQEVDMASVTAITLASSARYALVTKTEKLSIDMVISPHPFSPYIRPVIEYGQNGGPDGTPTPAGTCIKVHVEAPGTSVRSLKVHIYNSTGKLVWAADKYGAKTGENQIWWNGRTSGSGSGRTPVIERLWTEDMHLRTDNPMARNGRYFVTAVVTDWNNDQKRVMRPLVLMK